ncbi:hypothetical protein TREMEDRAFT_45163 [Tremella mesenterica DSM 1558]|uniref:uncharacterized protein n=1 Tax=Tremella mesenterica (strain ATCC 24925 / CBS 8224 / DSM 1558 / NBRC 9311 / NRRL Y-6157 / RJB 2259-6 / UBC 559-6) TaxID=578456 RepID=UPI0003F49E70|nr:uncharacterized protein TREMEDRAFT_45163 [Tremella mesenterica DSM 1558]EIW67646.1 hypothetical protein TREMEDRAFT_45163 [Tremella mesenterica DSM 1558]
MDLSYDLVASKCAEQMARYQQCVLTNQAGDWGSICRPEGQALTLCADASVPHLAQLKTACAPNIQAYRACLDAHAKASQTDIEKRCGQLMKDLWKCSEAAMTHIKQNEDDRLV